MSQKKKYYTDFEFISIPFIVYNCDFNIDNVYLDLMKINFYYIQNLQDQI
jgi:hypothetical protein